MCKAKYLKALASYSACIPNIPKNGMCTNVAFRIIMSALIDNVREKFIFKGGCNIVQWDTVHCDNGTKLFCYQLVSNVCVFKEWQADSIGKPYFHMGS